MNRLIILASTLALVAACDDTNKVESPPAAPAPAVIQAPPPAPAPTPPPVVEEKAPSPYVVVPGDTLYSIARAHDVTPADLAKWNKLENADLIQVGQELVLAPAE